MSAVDDFTALDQAQFLGEGLGMDNSYAQPVTPYTVTSTLATQGQGVSNAGLGQWTGFLQNVGKTLLTYGLAKDQMETQADIAKARYGTAGLQPIYQASAGGVSISPMLLIGLAVVAIVVLKG
ncbi:hypothetical protein GN316_03075 [Xylophilus sp. Kf1]|nr:hypothetical protein [Xylophilus sp. Kf1]